MSAVRPGYDVDAKEFNNVNPSGCFKCPDRSTKTEFEEKYEMEVKYTDGVVSFKGIKVFIGDKVYNTEVENIGERIECNDPVQKLVNDYYHWDNSQRENAMVGVV